MTLAKISLHCILKAQSQLTRSSLPEVFYKQGVLENYAKFKGLFFNKVAVKKKSDTGAFM